MKVPSFVTKLFTSIVSSQGGVSGGGWFPLIKEPYGGAWQNNDPLTVDSLLAVDSIFACLTLIAGDVAKLRFVLKEKDSSGIWSETSSPSFSPFLKKPNRFQNHIQFKEAWILSKLTKGNTYGLKMRDNRGVVTSIFILDPDRVTPMVASDGEIYYQLAQDNLNGVSESADLVPASEIIHDRMNCLFHPLVGISPIFASALAASQGQSIQRDSQTFFNNGARPSGILTAPGAIGDDTALRLKQHWEENYTGKNSGRVAVLGDGLSFVQMKSKAVDSQLVEQLKLTSETVCSTFHVPPFKIGVGPIPAGQKVQDLNQIYYADCLQRLIEDMELCLDEGLSLQGLYSVELDLEGLLRMDSETQHRVLGQGIKDSLYTPNGARAKVNLPPIEGGDTIYMQQQNYSLSALSKRDAKEDPFATTGKTPAPAAERIDPEPLTEEEQIKMLSMFVEKELFAYEH